MVTIGIDAHKRTHTAVIVNEHGTQLATKTITTTSASHRALLEWAREYDPERRWAVEDCRHLSRRLERDLLMAGEHIVRVPPKLMPTRETRPGPTANPIRSTRSRSPEQHNANRTCQSRDSTGQNAKFAYSSTTAKTSYKSEPASKAVCAGTYTNSIPHPSPQRAPSTAPEP